MVAVQAALIVRFNRDPTGSILSRALNAGIPLSPDDGQVLVYPSGLESEPVADGRVNELIEVPPGQYDALVIYEGSDDQQAVWLEGLTVTEDELTSGSVEFRAGQLKLDGPGDAVAYVFDPDDHSEFIASAEHDSTLLLAEGEYDVRVVLMENSEERDVRWLEKVPVNAGLLTEKTVAFQRGFLRVDARNGESSLPPGAVSLTLYRARDPQLEVVDSGLNGVPLDLKAGAYDIRATLGASNDRPERWLRNIQVLEDETVEHSLEFASGTVVVRAFTPDNTELGDYQVYVYFYNPDDHQEAVTYAAAGQPVTLSSGEYDVRANFFRSHDQPDIWIRRLRIETGQTVSRRVTFESAQLLVRAYDQDGNELIGDNVFLYVYPAGVTGTPFVTTRSGEEVTLAAGRYDIRATDSRTPGDAIWIRGLELRSGDRVERSLKFLPK